MTASDNRKLASRFFEEVINERKVEEIENLFDPDHVLHYLPRPEEQSSGPEGVKSLVDAFHNVSPDFTVEIEDETAQGDEVVTRWTGRGRIGDAGDENATAGDQVTVSGTSAFRIANNKIAETRLGLASGWDESDEPVPMVEHQEEFENFRSTLDPSVGDEIARRLFCIFCPRWCYTPDHSDQP
jgi:predicted SnoaL-like aldol condensation-catalyzing enzyme